MHCHSKGSGIWSDPMKDGWVGDCKPLLSATVYVISTI